MTALTEQQGRVLRLIQDGKSQGEIGSILRLSRYRVRVIVRRICDLHGVDFAWELPDARTPALEEEMPDDGRIRVDGSESKV